MKLEMEWRALCWMFDFFKTIANGCARIMKWINGRLRELIKKMEERQ